MCVAEGGNRLLRAEQLLSFGLPVSNVFATAFSICDGFRLKAGIRSYPARYTVSLLYGFIAEFDLCLLTVIQ